MRTSDVLLVAVTLAGSPAWSQWIACTNETSLTCTNSNVNVGIGTTNPTSLLQISSSGSATEQIGTTGSGVTWVSFSNQYGWSYAGLAGTADYYLVNTNATGYLNLGTNNTTRVTINPSGNVGVGTTNPCTTNAPSGCIMSVNGAIQAKEIVVNTGWPDYVFDTDYDLHSLKDVASYIKENHHLPGIPSQAEVEEKGVSLGVMQAKLLAKIEELTLHMIHAEDRNDRLEQENAGLRQEIRQIKDSLSR